MSDTNPNGTMSLAEKARRLAPTLRARAEETAQLRRLPDNTWQDLVDTGLVRGLQPARWGGVEANLRDFYEGVVEVARADGSTGWVLGIAGVHPWQTALFPARTQEEMWGKDPTVINSSSYAPTGKAVRAPDGYRLSGRWSFSTGCDHCSWVNLGAIVETVTIEGKEVPDFHSFLLPRTDYRIDDNWHVVGLAGTGSKDIVVEDAFVPEHRSQSHWDYVFDRPLPGWEVNKAPLYRLPFGPVFNTTLTAAVIGAAAGFLDMWIEISRTRKTGLGVSLAQDPFAQKLLAEARYAIDGAMLRLYTDAEAMMASVRAGEPIPLKRRAELRYHACRSAQLCARMVDELFEASSGRAIFLDHPLQRRYQDVKAMLGHTYLNPDQPARLYGAMELGLPILDAFL
jgi:3-hydroxy-9,10-secoandrosta-1,3,5(10)-triene-9,17-dione monooxygenase